MSRGKKTARGTFTPPLTPSATRSRSSWMDSAKCAQSTPGQWVETLTVVRTHVHMEKGWTLLAIVSVATRRRLKLASLETMFTIITAVRFKGLLQMAIVSYAQLTLGRRPIMHIVRLTSVMRIQSWTSLDSASAARAATTLMLPAGNAKLTTKSQSPH